MCFSLTENAFLYADHEYFDWFRNPNADTLKAVLKWKGLHRAGYTNDKTIEHIWGENGLNQATFNKYSLVTRVFLHHLNSPTTRPILDRYAWKAMKLLQPQHLGLPIVPTSWENHYLEYYVPFFNQEYEAHGDALNEYVLDGVDVGIVKRRVLDRALFEYGRRRP